MPMGTIVCNVFTSQARIPVEGTTVTFVETPPPSRLLGIRISNKSGLTAPVSVETKPKNESQSPGVVRPWTTCDIVAEHPAFERVTVNGVQIFAGIQTSQDIRLIPLQEIDPAPDEGVTFQITPQPLGEGDADG